MSLPLYTIITGEYFTINGQKKTKASTDPVRFYHTNGVLKLSKLR